MGVICLRLFVNEKESILNPTSLNSCPNKPTLKSYKFYLNPDVVEVVYIQSEEGHVLRLEYMEYLYPPPVTDFSIASKLQSI